MIERGTSLKVPDADADRVYSAWCRRMLIDGTWSELLAAHIERQLGPLRARLIGVPDTSENLLASVVDQTSTIYDSPPDQMHSDPASLATLSDSFERGGWWTMARSHQRYVRAVGESLVYVGWDDERGHATFELVTSDRVTIDASPHNRSRPMTVWWGLQRRVGNELAWCWDRWSVEGGVGTYSIWSNDREVDITARYVDPSKWSGDQYPYRDEHGRPLLPLVLYTSDGSGGRIWGPRRNSDIVTGSLQLGLLWSAAVHGVLRASWDQRFILNGAIKGGGTEQADGAGVRTIVADPTSMMMVSGDNASVANLGASIDIEKAERFCRMYGNRLAVNYGLSPADVVIESLNPASGASITVSQDGKRRISKRDLPFFRRGDRALATVVAAVCRAHGVPCTSEGYRLRYRGIELTADERMKVAQHLETEMRLGLADAESAYQELHPGVTSEEADTDLEAIALRRERAEVVAALSTGGSDDSGAGDASDGADAGGSGAATAAVPVALNGAQVQSLVGIVESVAAGALPRDSAVAIVQLSFNVDSDTANSLVGSAGRGFVPSVEQ